jgi:uncharacterized protein
MAHAEAGDIHVEVAYSPRAGSMACVTLHVPVGTTVQQALERSGLIETHPEVSQLPVGIWGRVQPADTVLRDHDRVEVYRPLQVDPKEARRQRYKKQRR